MENFELFHERNLIKKLSARGSGRPPSEEKEMK
jgi:hypothetical protein